MLRFHARQETRQRFAQPLLRIKSEDCALDVSGHEEKGPSCCLNFPLECGMSDFDRCPSARIRLALEPQGVWEVRALFNQDAPPGDSIRHGAFQRNRKDAARRPAQPSPSQTSAWAFIRPSFVVPVHFSSSLWPKLWPVRKPRLFKPGPPDCCFALDPGSLPLRRFLIVEALRLHSGRPCRRFKRF